jgi:hypothetical protein
MSDSWRISQLFDGLIPVNPPNIFCKSSIDCCGLERRLLLWLLAVSCGGDWPLGKWQAGFQFSCPCSLKPMLETYQADMDEENTCPSSWVVWTVAKQFFHVYPQPMNATMGCSCFSFTKTHCIQPITAFNICFIYNFWSKRLSLLAT